MQNIVYNLFLQKRGRLRPSSAPNYGRGSVGVGGKEGPVLYKVFVTTADKKGAGTDAKVMGPGPEVVKLCYAQLW